MLYALGPPCLSTNVRTMSGRRFFFISLAAAVLAVGLQGAALRQYSRGAQTIAFAVKSSESARREAKAEADRIASRGEVIAYAGIAVALASIGFVIASARRREPAWRSLTFALLCFYVMLHFTLV